MQIDLHYYATYALARMALIKPEAAARMAYAAMYLDDSLPAAPRSHPQGPKLAVEVSALHPTDYENLDHIVQRRVWTPFHFLPGGQGRNFFERMTCLRNGPLVRGMLEHHLEIARGVGFGWELLGVAAHVFLDSFSHHGFSGISSPYNQVEGSSIRYGPNTSTGSKAYFKLKAGEFKYQQSKRGFWSDLWDDAAEVVGGGLAETLTGGLGHAAVLLYPDLPYLQWSFEYEARQKGTAQFRDNPSDFEQACLGLHAFFRRVAGMMQAEPSAPTASIAPDRLAVIKDLLSIQDGRHERSAHWHHSIASGELFELKEGDRSFTPYDRRLWDHDLDSFPNIAPAKAADLGVYRFFQAVSLHRHWVLRELLPAHGLIVI